MQKIFTQLVGAVVYVHNLSCVHRDLKLENILLDKHENVKLCDFGFTRDYEGKSSYLQTFCGTICYSAPEMLKGEKYAGEKVDVWSLGIILYALLTGELPFDDDDDMVTKHKVLQTEPRWPDTMQPEAKALVASMLSKRPILRPSLADILTNPFLAEHAPQQQAILKLTQPPPFTTPVEKDTLERMRSAGIDIDKVIEHVLAQRCDPLAGWWALAIEKEERKEKRRERKRKDREAEAKNLRRLSAASSRLDRIAGPLKEVDEEQFLLTDPSRSRGRRERRETPNRELPSRRLVYASQTEDLTAQIVIPELPKLPEGTALDSPSSPTPPPPIEKDSVRSSSSSRPRPLPPPKEPSKTRTTTLRVIPSNQDLLKTPNASQGYSKRKGGKKHQHAIINQLASIKHWFVDSAKRAKSPSAKSETSTLKVPSERRSPADTRRSPTIPTPHRTPPPAITPNAHSVSSYPTPLRISANHHRSSLSPAPLTPRSVSYRRTSGLRGRKSTSSSVSSIRSIHRPPAHSKASSTSSTSNSVTSSALHHSSAGRSSGQHHINSPHNSVKVLPATPTFGSFPSNIRLVRGPPQHNYNESFGPSPSLVFAKRRKTPFRGPALTLGTTIGSYSPGSSRVASSSGAPASHGKRDQSVGSHRSASAAGRRSGEIIEEEDEAEIEEVDAFSPVPAEAEEVVWETKTGEDGSGEWVRRKGPDQSASLRDGNGRRAVS